MSWSPAEVADGIKVGGAEWEGAGEPIPITWPIAQLAEESKLITKGTTPTSVGFRFADAGVPFVRVQNLVDGSVFIENDPLFIDRETHDALRRSKICPGDILISIAGTIGRTAIVSDTAGEMNCNQAVAIIRPGARLDKSYLRFWLESREAISQIAQERLRQPSLTLASVKLARYESPFHPLKSKGASRRSSIRRTACAACASAPSTA